MSGQASAPHSGTTALADLRQQAAARPSAQGQPAMSGAAVPADDARPAEALRVAVVGGGPAGLMAAETLAAAGFAVDLYDAMPSLARKLLIAGKGGLNITHSEPAATFRQRYGARAREMAPLLDAFGPEQLREWMRGLGIDSFVGSSGRVFPLDMKAAPLLRAWLRRLRASGVRLHVRHRCLGVESTPESEDAGDRVRLRLQTPDGEHLATAAAAILALGGGSWAKLGADGRWLRWLTAAGVPVAPLRPANCGFDVGWSEFLRSRFAGEPVKSVAAWIDEAAVVPAVASRAAAVAAGSPAEQRADAVDALAASATGAARRRGEFVVTENGVEGSLIYALSAPLRDAIERDGCATLWLDLLPERSIEQVAAEIAHARGRRSLSSHLASRLGLKGVKAALLHEFTPADVFAAAAGEPQRLAMAIKALPVRLRATRPLDEAISSAGGVLFEALDDKLMLQALPGVFCAGEMLDWEAPTGGYLLTGCFASGHAAGLGAANWIKSGLNSGLNCRQKR